jgi:spore coat protein A
VGLSRRRFVGSAAALAVSHGLAGDIAPALDPDKLEKFVDPLPIPPVAKSLSRKTAARYRLAMRESWVQLHRDLPPTRLWTYNGSFPGPTIEARSEEPLTVEWPNQLPRRHFLPVDHTLHGAEADKPEVRAVVHVHGAKVPPESDGYPENWYPPGQSATSLYPNRQEAATLFYHDHAMGITRLNTWAGLFGLYIIRDDFEDALALPKGPFEIPLVITDRLLRRDGQLDYPRSDRPNAPWAPEAFGNVMLVNGKAFPYLNVEPRRYRFRLLNASNGRFYHLSLSNGQPFSLIGCDQGLLPAPVAVSDFVFAPGERVDLTIDFSEHGGSRIVLRNDAFVMMEFRVGGKRSTEDHPLPSALRAVPRTLESAAVRTRVLTIDEYMSMAGQSMLMLLNNAHWSMPVTEKPVLDSTEIWSIVNPTDDSHPIHLHLVRFQLLDRRAYDPLTYRRTGEFRFIGGPIGPEPAESGWKDTIRAHSRMVTRFIVRFSGFTGRYVWHCHILEHEDNEMMRPYEVIAAKDC